MTEPKKRLTIHEKECNDYFNYSEKSGGMALIENNTLICKDCIYRTIEVSTCKIFKYQKPGSAFYKNNCVCYIKF